MPVDEIFVIGTNTIDQTKEFTIKPVPKVTGPFGIWWYPILVRLAQYFPWAQKLLTIIATYGK
jgi:hypothetical protein